MASKKTAKPKAKNARRDPSRKNGAGKLVSRRTACDAAALELVSDRQPPRPKHLNPETEEERKKRLAKRKAMTIKAFQMAYEDHRRRKAS